MVPTPLSPYGVSKLTGEHYCKVFSELYGLQTVALRYFNVFGPRQDPASEYAAVIPKFITRILKKESPVIYGDGSQTRDFTFVKDVVQANIRAMESSAQGIFNVAYQEQIDLNAHSSISRLGHDTTAVLEAAKTKWNVSSLPPRSGRWPRYPG